MNSFAISSAYVRLPTDALVLRSCAFQAEIRNACKEVGWWNKERETRS
jgi:hypothetical protein